MSARAAPRAVVVGDGPAAEAALTHLPGAVRLAPPDAVWHAEPGRVWVEGGGRAWAEAFDALLLCADEPLLLCALGCALADGRPITDPSGATSVPGVFAAGAVRGARTPDEAAEQGHRAAEALLAGAPAIPSAALPSTALPSSALHSSALPSPAAPPPAVRLDPLGLAALLEGPLGPERDAAALEQAALLGPVLPARPVSLSALAALAQNRPAALPPQRDGDEP